MGDVAYMRILMINVPYAGHVNPTIPLTGELVKRGHQVTYINTEEFRAKIEAAGDAFLPYRDFPADPSDEQKKRRCFQASYDTAMALETPFRWARSLAISMLTPLCRKLKCPVQNTWTRNTAPTTVKASWKVFSARGWGLCSP